MNIFLITLNLLTNPEVLWFFGAFFGWGAGLIAHYVKDVVKIGGKLDAMEARALEVALTDVSGTVHPAALQYDTPDT